ncbi:MAG: M55 family metallopeptidase [Lentisphaerae bacterium]|nr:M55 family metallopeptidase [Lentisphaerota bacterium]
MSIWKRKYYTADLNACIRGCFNAGAEAVLARDGHGSGNHVIWDELDPRAELFQGRNETGHLRFPRITECDALILLGYHAMAGTRGALLEHTYSSAKIQNMWLNGRPVGEIGLDAAVAAEYGVPTILVTGDDHVCLEARAWIPGVMTCEVKKSLGNQGAFLLSQPAAHRLIESSTAAAIRRIGDIKPVQVQKPVTVRTEVVERGQIPRDGADGFRVLDGRTYERTADTVLKAWLGW